MSEITQSANYGKRQTRKHKNENIFGDSTEISYAAK